MANTAFYIAKRYLLAEKGSTAVTFITWLAVFAMSIAVASMFIIVSVFSGLEDLNREMISNLHADLTIESGKGKTLTDTEKVAKTLKKNSEVLHFSKLIEEKVYLDYQGKGDVAYLRGVDSAYVLVNPIDKSVFFGKYPCFQYSNEVLIEHSLDARLSFPVATDEDFATVIIPKAGKGLINKEEDIFNKKEVFASGVFPGNDQLNNYIIAPLELTEELLNLPKNSAYQIVIKLKNSENADLEKEKLQKELGSAYVIKTKKEQNAAFWKMINTEKLFIYLIFILVIFITTFNLAGAIVILQLDKKEQARSLVSLGFPIQDLRKVYFYTGCLIVTAGIIIGLIFGTLICYFQMVTGIFKANETFPFPVRINVLNYFLVTFFTAFFGIIISWFFSRVKRTLQPVS